MALLKDKWLIPIGCICLSVAILVDRFVAGNGFTDFLIGLLTGVSVVLNLVGLYRSRKL